MNAQRIVDLLLGKAGSACVEALIGEASVHLPRRGHKWIAAFRDENGQPVWRTTGLSDRQAAQAMADKWQAEARRKRVAQGGQTRQRLSVRAGSGANALGLFTQKEVATILRISERAVRAIERRAIEKLRQHPVLKEVMREWQEHDIDESAAHSDSLLSQAEVEAVFALAKTPYERSVLKKLLRIVTHR